MCKCGNSCSNNCCTTVTRYQGANIDCVGINTLDSLDEVVRKLSEYVCNIDGTDGIDGVDGDDGVGISSITYSAFSGQITVNLTDGSNFISGDLRGQGVDHVAFTSTTGSAQGQPGETDTYTFWGDVLETINLGTFVVTNGYKPYREYAININQSGASDPVVNVYQNDLGAIVWTRNTDGIYFGDLLGAFTGNRQIFLSPTSNPNTFVRASVTDDQIQLFTVDELGTFIDGALINVSLTIRIYD